MDTVPSLSETPAPTPPGEVLAALGLMGVTFALALIRLALMKDWSHPTSAGLSLLILGAVCSFWLYGLWVRTTWLWWFTVVSGALGSVLAPLSVASLYDEAQIALYWAQFALCLPAIVLLLLPKARNWYRRAVAA